MARKAVPVFAAGFLATQLVALAGAAPGYVEDRVCGGCHVDIAASFPQLGMGRSFSSAKEAPPIEDFATAFYHPPSRRHYRMTRRDDGSLLFRRWQVTSDGRTVNLFEQEVDWVLGSGNHARTYLYRTPSGELFQLPIAWYSQTGRWGMAPGFDAADHSEVLRQVRRECMFCHNGYPELPEGGDVSWEPDVYPATLPSGIGCQRCHGPGAEHARRATEGRLAEGSAIVDPAALPSDRRRDVCYQCHLQPSVAVAGLHRFGRGDFSFRPGEALAEDVVHVVVEQEGVPAGDRFEINHHPFRLEQSACFQESGGALSCLSCHDPHRKPPLAERKARYRAVCLGCHTVDACTLDGMSAAAPSGGGVEAQDCVGCHMATRRPRDVVQVTMTDHLIRRRPGGPELVAPRAEETPTLVELRLLDPATAPAGDLGELYRVGAYVRSTGGIDAGSVDFLARLVGRLRPASAEPYRVLARGLLAQKRPSEALAASRAALEREPRLASAFQASLVGALTELDRGDEAIAVLVDLLAKRPELAEARFALGRLYAQRGDLDNAADQLERAVASRPVLPAGWLYLGRVRLRQGRVAEAVAAARRALAIEPGFRTGYEFLAEALRAAGDPRAAELAVRDGGELAHSQ